MVALVIRAPPPAIMEVGEEVLMFTQEKLLHGAHLHGQWWVGQLECYN